jgi:hypothetical protein
MKRHLNIRPYECQKCKARFARSSTLKIHSHTHLTSAEEKEIVVEYTSTCEGKQPKADFDFKSLVNSTDTLEGSSQKVQDGGFAAAALLLNNPSLMGAMPQNAGLPLDNLYGMMCSSYLFNNYRDTLLLNSMINQQQIFNYLNAAAATQQQQAAGVGNIFMNGNYFA